MGALALLTDERYAGKLPLFGGLDKARFRGQVAPGDELVIEVTMTRLSARASKGEGRATVDGELATSCELMCVMVDAEGNGPGWLSYEELSPMTHPPKGDSE